MYASQGPRLVAMAAGLLLFLATQANASEPGDAELAARVKALETTNKRLAGDKAALQKKLRSVEKSAEAALSAVQTQLSTENAALRQQLAELRSQLAARTKTLERAIDVANRARQAATQPVDDPLSGRVAYPVSAVVDGDTIKVKMPAGVMTVRLIGVDTPETVHPTRPVEHFGREASAFLTKTLKGESVYLRGEKGKPTKDKYGRPAADRYGRILAYVYRASDGLFINAEIIRQGYGHAYTKYPFGRMEEFRGLERAAREAKRGLWAAKTIPAKPASTKEVTVYGTRTGSKYHRVTCRHLRRSRIPMSLSAAKKRYSPCSVCSPPR